MPLSPEDIEGTHFLVALRGYDKDQVDAFLKEVAAEHRSLLRRVQHVRDRREGDDPFDKLVEQVETVARAAITAAEKIEAGARSEAAELRRRAEAEAEAVRAEAEMLRAEAADLRTRAEAEAETLRVEGAELRRQLER